MFVDYSDPLPYHSESLPLLMMILLDYIIILSRWYSNPQLVHFNLRTDVWKLFIFIVYCRDVDYLPVAVNIRCSVIRGLKSFIFKAKLGLA